MITHYLVFTLVLSLITVILLFLNDIVFEKTSSFPIRKTTMALNTVLSFFLWVLLFYVVLSVGVNRFLKTPSVSKITITVPDIPAPFDLNTI